MLLWQKSNTEGLAKKRSLCLIIINLVLLPEMDIAISKIWSYYRSPKFIWAPCAQLYSLAETTQPLPPPPHLGSNTRSLLPYWSAKIDDISLRPPGNSYLRMRKGDSRIGQRVYSHKTSFMCLVKSPNRVKLFCLLSWPAGKVEGGKSANTEKNLFLLSGQGAGNIREKGLSITMDNLAK
jgi:hypothetical protein